jgi:hypothetical protein
MLWVSKDISYTTRQDILDLDNWMKQMSQLSHSGEPIIQTISTEPGRNMIILQLKPFDYKLAERIKSQAILDKI